MGLTHHAWRYRENVTTLPELLATHGYRTALIGLQHENVDPSVLGFDVVGGVGFLPRAWQVAHATEKWLEQNAGDKCAAPVFLTVGIWEVHRPWPSTDYSPSPASEVEVPPYLPDGASTREDIGAFYGSIRQMDEAVGKLLDAVDRHLDPAETLIVFTTDHGAAFPGAKGTLYDTGTGVTLIMRPPTSWGVAPGRHKELVSHLDIVPTFLDIAGADAEAVAGYEGVSLVPLLRHGEACLGNAPVLSAGDRLLFSQKNFHDSYDPIRAIRSDRFKYIRNFGEGPRLTLSIDLEDSPARRDFGDQHLQPRAVEELYDLERDPWERENVAADPAYASVRTALSERLLQWMEEMQDPLLKGAISPPPPRSRSVDALPALKK